MLVELRLNDNERLGSLPLGFGSIASLTVLDTADQSARRVAAWPT
ncbi:MAG: hypothetical protein R2710_00055 [Acidimicrobiales bacterium]